MNNAISINNLSLCIGASDILNDVTLSLGAGRITALIGRSGSGKSMTALAMMGLTPDAAEAAGAIMLDGENLLERDEPSLCAIRGGKIGMVFQEPMTALNPLQTIGAQVAETIRIHTALSKHAAAARAGETLARVGLDPEQISPDRYPHELSGGQRQRVVIAIAIAMKPKVLIADEPTTALDVTTQAEILALLKQLAQEDGVAVLLITHDLAIVSDLADEIAVMRDGAIVHAESADRFYASGPDPAAREFLPARVTRNAPERSIDAPVLSVENVSCDYAHRRRSLFAAPGRLRAVDNVSFELQKGENLGLVGASGCGKSTLARALLGLAPLAEGRMRLAGEAFPAADPKAMRRLRRKIQIVFQDPYSSFNPRQRIADIIAEPLHLLDARPAKAERDARAARLLESVGLPAEILDRYPHQFSGGQRQRIAIARALATDPEVIIFDEGTSALDIASRNRILELLEHLSETRGVSLLLITHDLSVIRDIADRVMVMRDGRIVETGAARDIFETPQDAYTKALIDAAPVIRWRVAAPVEGETDG